MRRYGWRELYVFELHITELTKFGNGVMCDLCGDEKLDEAHRLGAWRSTPSTTTSEKKKIKNSHEIKWDIHQSRCPWLS